MGRIYQQKHILKDANGQPLLDAKGKPKMKLRSAKWWISYYDANGKRHYESTGETHITKARKILTQREAAKDRGEPVGAQIGKITFDDAAQMVIDNQTMKGRRSVDREQGRIEKHLKPYFTGRRMTTITSDVITAYVIERQKAGAQDGSINRELQILHRAFTLAQRAGKILSAPYIEKLEEAEPRRGFFERAEFDACRALLPEHLRGLLTFYYLTGWRNSEVRALELRQVDLQAGTVTLDAAQSKTKRPRVIDFSEWPELRDVLTAQVQSAERIAREAHKIVVAVFHQLDGTALDDDDWRKAWEACRTAAGYPSKLVHDFRRTAVRNLIRAGVPETVAMRITGHKTRSVFERYNITSSDDLRQVGAKMEAFATGKPAAGRRGPVRQFRKRA